MRKRYVVNLDTDDNHEALILDYIAQHSTKKRQEVLRNLLRVGYATLIQHKKASAAVAAGVTAETAISVLEAFLSGAITINNQAPMIGLQYQVPHLPDISSEGQGRAIAPAAQSPDNLSPASPSSAPLPAKHERGGNFSSEIKSAPQSVVPDLPYVDVDKIEEDDDEDPLAKLMKMRSEQ